jgi:hypothetical protein
LNWEAISAVGEIVGATAVVVSLIYLAAQIRHNTSVTRSSVRHALTERAMSAAAPLVAYENLTRLLQRSIDGEKLEGYEDLRLNAWVYMLMRNWENIHYQHLTGLLSDTEWGAFQRNLKLLLQIPACQEYWDAEQEIYTDAFRTEVVGLLNEIRHQDVVSRRSVLMSESAATDG